MIYIFGALCLKKLITIVELVKNVCFTKPPREIKAPLQPLPAVSSFHTIYMDYVGPLPTTLSGIKYILNFIDSLTEWCESIPLHKTDAVIVGRALYDHVICRHGCPKVLITDSAKNFIAEVFSELCKILNIKNYTLVRIIPPP